MEMSKLSPWVMVLEEDNKLSALYNYFEKNVATKKIKTLLETKPRQQICIITSISESS